MKAVLIFIMPLLIALPSCVFAWLDRELQMPMSVSEALRSDMMLMVKLFPQTG